ncbi:MAG: hypothetical protein J6T10_01495 [Methanobrevibacter sp.]|nr:hypothetical protein [Methanobrevibacter sp.]
MINPQDIYDICDKFNLKSLRCNDFLYWDFQDEDILGSAVKYDFFFETISVTTEVLMASTEVMNLYSYHQVSLDELESSIQELIVKIKNARAEIRKNRFKKDFEPIDKPE